MFVIHVDNSGFFRKVMGIFLAELGLESKGFDRGEDVLDAVESRKVSCVICGLELMDMSGEELIKRLLFASYSMTIIAVTSSANEERAQRLKELGVKAIIQKGGNWKEQLREFF
ncbi:MAG: response regulator [Treponema sp.]|jgi:FixJ family two-component response regulator|nr:response regulator [Treponema sp.]